MDQRSATAPPERVKNIAFQSSQGIKVRLSPISFYKILDSPIL